MANLKVLKLEPWMTYSYNVSQLLDMLYIEENKAIGRDGWYLNGKSCWFEIDGKAYSSVDRKRLRDDFKYCLKQYNHRPLTDVARMAIKQLTADRLAPRSLRELLHTDTDWRSLREVKRHSQFQINKFIKRKGTKHNA